MDNYELPLKVGQLAESRSFLSGYRGAWFRCKIKDFRQRRKGMECSLEYTDFPDEKIEWTKMYEKPSAGRRSRTMKSQLMVRPSFPPVYRESQMPDVNSISEVVVIVNNVWKVGDLVDWWSDGCYWSARITESLGEGKFRIEIPLPPVGEGSTYEAFCTDLRPSLDWSPTDGWTLPIPERECCARLVKPVEQGSSRNLTIHAVDEVREDAQETYGASIENNASFSSHISASSLRRLDRSEQHRKRPLSPAACKDTQMPVANMGFDAVNAGIVKSSCLDSVSSSHVRDAAAAGTAAAREGYQNGVSLNKMRIDGSIPLNSLQSDTIEASILDLEELVNRVKWIKDILKLGTPSSNTLRPSWNFVEHQSSSTNDCFGKKMFDYRMKNLRPYHGRVNQHCKVSDLVDFSEVLERYGLVDRWNEGCFSQFSCLRGQYLNGRVVLNILNAEVDVSWARDDEMWFRLGGRLVRFGPREFVLITGLHFGDIPEDIYEQFIAGDDSVHARYFEGKATRIFQVSDLLASGIQIQRDDDVLKMLYAMYLCHFLLGRETRWHIPDAIWGMVEDIKYFESFPWGTYIYSCTLFWLRNALSGRGEGRKGKDLPTAVNIYGFVFAVQMWAMEMIPDFINLVGTRRNNSIPRIRRWYCRTRPQAVEQYFHDKMAVLPELVPTFQELETVYYQSLNPEQIIRADIYKLIPLHSILNSKRRGVPFMAPHKPLRRGTRATPTNEARATPLRHSVGGYETLHGDPNFQSGQRIPLWFHRSRAREATGDSDDIRVMVKALVASQAAFVASQAAFVASQAAFMQEMRDMVRQLNRRVRSPSSGGQWDNISPPPFYEFPMGSPMDTRRDSVTSHRTHYDEPVVEPLVAESAVPEPARSLRRPSTLLNSPCTVPKAFKNVLKVKSKGKDKEEASASTVQDSLMAFVTSNRERYMSCGYSEQITPRFFREILDVEAELHTQHVDTYLTALANRKNSVPTDFVQHVTFESTTFFCNASRVWERQSRRPNIHGFVYPETITGPIHGQGVAGVPWTSCTEILLPCNLGNSHWVMVKVNLPTRRIEVYDSLYSDDAVPSRLAYMEPLRHMLQIVFGFSKPFQVDVLSPQYVPQQTDGTSCGALMVKFIDNICRGFDYGRFDFKRLGGQQLRQVIVREIYESSWPV